VKGSEVNVKVKVYMDDSVKFIEEALKELKVGVENNDAIRIRDATEKAWNAVVQATNALILCYLGKTPSSHREGKRLLRELERVKPEVESLGLRDRYSAREGSLHELVFYKGVVDVNDVEFELEKAIRYVEDVGKLLCV
jgi:uncharacterized protein (UPF0332 family)